MRSRKVEKKLDTAENRLKTSDLELVESFIGKSYSMPRMSLIEENIEPEFKETKQEVAKPASQSLDRTFYKAAFTNGKMPELKNIAAATTASNQADAEMTE